jgi:hypothetical protein
LVQKHQDAFAPPPAACTAAADTDAFAAVELNDRHNPEVQEAGVICAIECRTVTPTGEHRGLSSQIPSPVGVTTISPGVITMVLVLVLLRYYCWWSAVGFVLEPCYGGCDGAGGL